MSRYRQLHLWITDHDYSLLRDQADARRETLSAAIRRLIKANGCGSTPSDDESAAPVPLFAEIAPAELV